MKVSLCPIETIPEDGTKTAAFFEREVIALKVEGKLKVYLNSCPHLGGSLRREGNKLICQSHNGQCLSGPAHPQSRLLRVPVCIEDGLLTYSANLDPQEDITFAQILPVLIHQNDDTD